MAAVAQAAAYALTVAGLEAENMPFRFVAERTMYGGKAVRADDPIFLFTAGASGALVMRVIVKAVVAVPRTAAARQTPRVSVEVADPRPPAAPLSGAELRPFTLWNDGRPETELNFKLYRQATPKLVGLTPAAAAFLHARF